MTGKEAVVACFNIPAWLLPGGIEEKNTILCWDSRCPGWDSNWIFPWYKILKLEPTWSFFSYLVHHQLNNFMFIQ
jgi:hypothetical protein